MIKSDIQKIPFEQVMVLLPTIEHELAKECQSFFEENGEKKYYVTYGFSDDFAKQDSFSQAVVNWLKAIEDVGVKKVIWRRLPEISLGHSIQQAKKLVQFSARLFCTDKDGKEIKLNFVKPESEPMETL